MSFHFYKETHKNQKVEIVNGFMYLKVSNNASNNSIYLYVTAPVNQIVEYNSSKTTIYYPEEKKAFIFESSRPSSVMGPLDAMLKTPDLGKAGLVLVKNIKTMDGNEQIWMPKDIAVAPIKEITIDTAANGVVDLVEIKDKQGKIMSRIKYSNFKSINNHEVPLFTETYSINGSGSSYESMRLTSPNSRAVLPEEIRDFKIPKDANVEKYKL
jgi:hypothetical protein